VKLDPAGVEDEPEGEDREACNEDELENDF
jgi:hypothetical protein